MLNIILALLALSPVYADTLSGKIDPSSAHNCFYEKELVYVYDIPDITGNYTDVQEYWLKRDHTCDFVIDVKCALDWYSSDIDVEY